jgi:hypothetical protein
MRLELRAIHQLAEAFTKAMAYDKESHDLLAATASGTV